MRKEGVIFLIVVAILLLLSINYYHLFNAFTLFIIAGGISGTQFSLPGSFMLMGTLLALTIVIAWPFRDALVKKITSIKKPLRTLQSKKF